MIRPGFGPISRKEREAPAIYVNPRCFVVNKCHQIKIHGGLGVRWDGAPGGRGGCWGLLGGWGLEIAIGSTTAQGLVMAAAGLIPVSWNGDSK